MSHSPQAQGQAPSVRARRRFRLSELRTHLPLEGEGSRPKLGSLRELHLLRGFQYELERRTQPSSALEVSGYGQALGRRLDDKAARRERLSRPRARSDCSLGCTGELVNGSESALRLREAFALALGPACVDDLFPDARGIDQLPAELGTPTQALERDEPPRFVLPRGPELERAPAETRGVPVGVDGTERLGGYKQLRTRPLRLARGQPVLCDQLRRRARSLEALGELAVMHPPPRPRDLRIHGLADEGVTKGREALVHLDEEAQLDRLLEARRPGEVGDEPEIDALACDRRHLERAPGRLREPVRAQEHGLPDAVRQRHVMARRKLNRVGPFLEPPACGECRRELLDEERHALGALEEPLHEPRPRPPLEDPRG